MRDPREWDEDYLVSLPVGEFDWLEAKGRRGLDLTMAGVREADVKRKLSKAISAFANSGGGVIVFGLRNPSGSWQVDDGGVDLVVKKPSTREWLEDIIPVLVDFPLSSFNVYVVQRSSDRSQIRSGRGVFVVDIPDSEQAPHQAIDNRYYARVGGKSRPIGHRLVLDIFGRRRDPKIALEFKIESSTYVVRDLASLLAIDPGDDGPPERKRKIELVVKARNVGRVYARYVNGFLYIPVSLVPYADLRLQDAELEEIDDVKYFVWYCDNTRRDVLRGNEFGPTEYGSSWFDPILPSLGHTWVWELPVGFHMGRLTDEKIVWEVFADNAAVNTGSVLVREIEFIFKD